MNPKKPLYLSGGGKRKFVNGNDCANMVMCRYRFERERQTILLTVRKNRFPAEELKFLFRPKFIVCRGQRNRALRLGGGREGNK